jgi:hypothetical protein
VAEPAWDVPVIYAAERKNVPVLPVLLGGLIGSIAAGGWEGRIWSIATELLAA